MLPGNLLEMLRCLECNKLPLKYEEQRGFCFALVSCHIYYVV